MHEVLANLKWLPPVIPGEGALKEKALDERAGSGAVLKERRLGNRGW